MKKKKQYRIIEVSIISLVLVAGGILLIPSSKRTLSPAHPPQPKATNVTSLAQRSQSPTNTVPGRSLEEVQAFFDVHLQKLLTETFPQGKFRIPEVQARYTNLEQKMRERYGREHQFDVVNRYAPHSRFVTMASGMKDGIPFIQVLMSSLIDLYEAGKNVGITEEEFERSFMTDFLHEFDHVSFGWLPKEGEVVPEETIRDNERFAWAETCEHTLRPLIEVHKLKVEKRHFDCYKAWVKGGRNVDSPSWKDYIQREYR